MSKARRKSKSGIRTGPGSANAGSPVLEAPLLAGWMPAWAIRLVGLYPILTVCLLLSIVTLTIYLQTLGHDFTNYDDWVYVTDNANVKAGLSVEGVKWAFTSDSASNWHPLTWISHMLDVSIYGLDHPGGHHFTSILLHLLNTLLLFSLLTRMTGSVWRSAFVAALFAAHPLRVESVAWVAERKDVLSGLFWILTMFAYLRYSRQPNIKRYLPVVGLFALGLLAKPMLVTLPFVLLLMDYWPLNRQKPIGALVGEKLPLFALSAGSSIVTYIVQHKSGAMMAMQHIPFSTRAENAVVACATYIGKMLWPANLSVFYPHPGPALSPALFAVCLAALVAASIFALGNRRRRPYLAVGWLWFVGTLAPVIGLVQVGEQAMADRYSYLTMIGLFIIIAWGIPGLVARTRVVSREMLPIAGAFVIIALMCVSYAYTSCWRNSRTLFEHALASTRNNYVAENNLGEAFETDGKLEQAMAHYSRAVAISPVFVPAQGNIANVLLAQGNIPEAVRRNQILVKLAPEAAGSHYNLGVTLQKAGRLQEAERELRKAIEIDPNHTGARGTLGNVLLARGLFDEAIKCYKAVMEIDPKDETARRNLEMAEARRKIAADPSAMENQRGVELAGQGKFAEAIPHYLNAVRINARNAVAHCNLGAALGNVGRQDEAIRHYRKALAIDPRLAEAHYNLASTLMLSGQYAEAIVHLRSATEIKPEFAPAHASLAVCLYNAGDYAGAWKEVHLCQNYRGSVDQGFLDSLSSKMPDRQYGPLGP